MVLKKCTHKELTQLVDITQTTYREHYQYLWKDKGEQYIKNNYSTTALSRELADSTVALYFITQQKEIYGFLKLQLHAALDSYTAKDALELARIYLLKTAIGKGIGKAVMEAVDKIAVEQAKKIIWLKTMDSSQAATFYQSCGYEICQQLREKNKLSVKD